MVGRSQKRQFNLLTIKIAVPAVINGEQQFGGAGDIHGAEYEEELRLCKVVTLAL